MRNVYSYSEPVGVENRVAEEASACESEGLPNRLLNASRGGQVRRPYAKRRFVAHTGADCSDPNGSASEEGGFTRETSSTGLRAEHQLESCEGNDEGRCACWQGLQPGRGPPGSCWPRRRVRASGVGPASIKGGRMAIRRRCRGTCRSARRCLEHLWFDVKHRNTRYRMPVNDFAVPRMEPSKQRPVQSMEEVRLGAAIRRRDQGWARSADQASRKEAPADLQRSPAFSTRISNVTCDRLGFAASTRRDESRS